MASPPFVDQDRDVPPDDPLQLDQEPNGWWGPLFGDVEWSPSRYSYNFSTLRGFPVVGGCGLAGDAHHEVVHEALPYQLESVEGRGLSQFINLLERRGRC